MQDLDPPFRPLRRRDGYLPLEDHGLIGDGTTAALVGADGAVSWMCLPHFDSDAVFCALLDHERGGRFTVAPQDLREARQLYEPDSGVLHTELRGPTGLVRVTDAMVLRSGADLSDDAPSARAELVRSATVLDGEVRLVVELEPRGGGQAQHLYSGLEIRPARRTDLRLHLRSSRPLTGLRTTYDLRRGDRLDLVLAWGRFHRHHRFDPDTMVRTTTAAWQRWMRDCDYAGPEEALVRRSAITLKMCDDWANGSLAAAPTSSLPAPIGGIRNWDYRYAWIRDASFTVFVLRRIGFHCEADAFLGWVLDAFERSRIPRIMYTLDGGPVPDEYEDSELEGYRGSAPVRWGNGAADQRQHDVYGEILDCADQWLRRGGEIQPAMWAGLSALADTAEDAWRRPDQGIWEIRGAGRPFTYSAGLCHVALDRAAAIAQRLGLPGDTGRWRGAADGLRDLVLSCGSPGTRTHGR